MTLLKSLMYSAAFVAAFATAGSVALAKDGHDDRAFPFGNGPTVSIGADGDVLVRGAEVSSVADGSITAVTDWGNHDLTWTVDTDSDTSYVGTKGSASARSDIEVGDTISFAGALEGSLSVLAKTVREWSLDDHKETFAAKVKSVSSASLVVLKGDQEITVNVTSDTKIAANGEDHAALSDIEEGDMVRLSGAFTSDDVMTAALISVNGEKHEDKPDRPWNKFLDFWHSFKLKF